jgi:hypothetical protein
MRKGALAVPIYFIAVGVGHVALAVNWSERTVGLPRDGQAFTGTIVLGVGFVFLGLLALIAALILERGRAAVVRGTLAALFVAGVLVAYTASRGYLMGGLGGGPPCITEPNGPVCAPGAGVYIADAQPDVIVMLLAAIVAWGLAHTAARLQERGILAPRRVATRP